MIAINLCENKNFNVTEIKSEIGLDEKLTFEKMINGSVVKWQYVGPRF